MSSKLDLIDFWQKQVKQWNDENKCGFCWQFGAPLSESQMNTQQVTDDCCLNVFITRPIWSGINEYRNTFGVASTHSATFRANFLIKSDIDTNNYNEILGHEIDESLYVKYIDPIIDCLIDDLKLNKCEHMGFKFDIPNWRIEPVVRYLDSNYCGVFFDATFRIRE